MDQQQDLIHPELLAYRIVVAAIAALLYLVGLMFVVLIISLSATLPIEYLGVLITALVALALTKSAEWIHKTVLKLSNRYLLQARASDIEHPFKQTKIGTLNVVLLSLSGGFIYFIM